MHSRASKASQQSPFRQANPRRPNSLLVAGTPSAQEVSEAATVNALVDRLQQPSLSATAAASWSLLRATYSPVSRKAMLITDSPDGSMVSRICNRLLQLLLCQRREPQLLEAARCLLCALANLTCGDADAKQLVTLHADGALSSAAVAQLHAVPLDAALGQAAAALLRNLGWRPRPACRRRLRQDGAAIALTRFVQRLVSSGAVTSGQLQCPLAALWNLTDSSVDDDEDNMDDRSAELLAICSMPDGVRCLCECLASPDVDVAESSGGVLRNLTPALTKRWDRLAPAVRPALPLLVRMLDISSSSSSTTTITMAANASRLLACISGLGRARERRLLSSLGAEAALRWLLRVSQHRCIRQDCRTALANLASSTASPAVAVPLSPSSLSLRPSSSIASDRELSPLVEEEIDSHADDGWDGRGPPPPPQQPPPPMSLLASPSIRPSRSVRPLGVVAPMPKLTTSTGAASASSEQQSAQPSHCRLSSSLSKDSGYAEDNSSIVSASMSPQSPSPPPPPTSSKLLPLSASSSRHQSSLKSVPCSRLAVPVAESCRNRLVASIPVASGIPVKSTAAICQTTVTSATQKTPTRRTSGIPRSASLVSKEIPQPTLNLRPPVRLFNRSGIALRHATVSSSGRPINFQQRCSAPPK